MRKLPFVVLVLASMSLSSAAVAQSQSDKSVAEALFRAGKDLEKQGKVAEACAKYAESHRLDPKPGTALNVATCHESIGRTATAWADYAEAATFAARAHQSEREKFARGKVAELEKKLSFVTFQLPDVKGLEVSLDGGKPFSAAGTRLPLDPGEHAVEVKAPGKVRWTKTLVVDAGPSEKAFEIPPLEDEPKAETAPPPAAAAVAAPPAHAVPHGNAQRTIAWVALGVGVVGVGLGSYYGIRTLSLKSDRDRHCVDPQHCDDEGVRLDRDARSSATIADIAMIAGGAVAVTGLVLLITAPPSSRSAKAHALIKSALAGRATFVW